MSENTNVEKSQGQASAPRTGWASEGRNQIEALFKQEIDFRGVCIENGFRSQKEIWAIENVLRQTLDLLEKKPYLASLAVSGKLKT